MIGAHDLTIEADITYRQLDFWTRTGLLVEHDRDEFQRQGYPRYYDDNQAAICVLMGRLVKAGFQARHARKLVDELRQHGHATVGSFVLKPNDAPSDQTGESPDTTAVSLSEHRTARHKESA